MSVITSFLPTTDADPRSSLVSAADHAAAEVVALARLVSAGSWACDRASTTYDRAVFDRATSHAGANLGRACMALDRACEALKSAGLESVAKSIIAGKNREINRQETRGAYIA